ncbi:L-arabinose isomerase [Euzebyella saccharophila]|uniref:L-arabinose isomerase n=1 Tax=Euzebyella saccharophila TaxID=679664 RepID=A0ABV8JJK0_9FLAO|nr:L-arabinose isomerase [Euzebyella saccharophila]
MNKISNKEIWFVTGTQHLYGPETLKQVAENSKIIAEALNESTHISLTIVHKAILKTPSEILEFCVSVNTSDKCIGIIGWMHTFSPAKMWVNGLKILNKPLCHLHTQFNAEIPWSSIDMNFMNLNQSAHGDREFGHIMSRMRINRKVVVGHWKEKRIQHKIGVWSRVALGVDEMKNLKVARFGDNMREVAVTEGDKVGAQIKFGMSVNGYDSSDITSRIEKLSKEEINGLVTIYEESYHLAPELLKHGKNRESLLDAAKIELAMREFLHEGGYMAFTDTFENLGSLKQLPGLPVQRLMADGYGFGGEGDWKTAALTRVMKVMAIGLQGGTSFMEDYTYHFSPTKNLVMGSHMLEICPTIADAKPSCEVHPLRIGAKDDPVRLVFNSPAGKALNASLIDIGDRFRLIVNEVEAVKPLADLPKLPVARVIWDAKPNLDVAATAWILAGGAHHTVYTQALTTEFLEDFAEIFGIELLVIDDDTRLRSFKDLIHSNEAYYHGFQRGY